MISLKIAAHRGILGGYLCKELRLYVLGRAPIFFFFFFFNSSIRHVQWKSVFIAFSPCLTNYDVKRRKHIMILLICVVAGD